MTGVQTCALPIYSDFKFSITAGDELEITVGKSSLVMKSDGTVLINGTKFDFTASGPVAINGKDVDIN